MVRGRKWGGLLAREHPSRRPTSSCRSPNREFPPLRALLRSPGIPYADGLVKNRYIGRTFIEPNQLLRDRGVKLKLNPITDTLAGKRVVLIDDSIVRGSTTRQLVAMVREAGAREVHLRISSPPYRWPCYYGMDTSDRSTLIASRLDTDGDSPARRCRLPRLSVTRGPPGQPPASTPAAFAMPACRLSTPPTLKVPRANFG